MEAKKRTPSKELQILEILSYRGKLSEREEQHYLNLKKGYEGEVMFDQILHNQLQQECYIIKDLLFKINNNKFQIDTLIVFQDLIEFYEIKNFEGEYTFERDNFYKHSNFKITNPEHQLNRAETLLQQLLLSQGYNVPIKSSVVFVNPEFTLYNAPHNKPFILPSQINSLLKRLNANNSKLTNRSKIISDKLISLHQEDSPYDKLPTYSYDQLKKGISCKHCYSFSIKIAGHYCYCNNCDEREKLADAVIRSTQQLLLLFPNKTITTNEVYDWCSIIPSKQRIRRILQKRLNYINKRSWSYYEWKEPGK
jgi:hypothetical protein